MSAYTSGPIHTRARYVRPTFIRTTLAPPRRWGLGVLRSSCGHALGIYALYANRQSVLRWKACR